MTGSKRIDFTGGEKFQEFPSYLIPQMGFEVTGEKSF